MIRNFLTEEAYEEAAEPFAAKVNRKILTLVVENIKLSSVSLNLYINVLT